MIRLAVIVVSYNVRDLLRACLSSVFAAAARGVDRFETSVWVVDNASTDGSAAMVASAFPQTQLLALTKNVGFTGGNNLALRELGFAISGLDDPTEVYDGSGAGAAHRDTPDYVLLLNPDAEVLGNAVSDMLIFMETHRDTGICGARLQYGDGSFQHGAFRFPSLAQVALDFFPLSNLPGAHRLHDSGLNGRYPKRLWAGTKPFVVDFVLGAAMFVRGKVIRMTGGFDDAYFMYCEEMDWCMRLQEAGWVVFAVPTAHVVHHAGMSSQQVRWAAYERLWCSRFRFYRVHGSRYSAAYLMALRSLVRIGLAAQRRTLARQFAHGEITGAELGEALAAFRNINRL